MVKDIHPGRRSSEISEMVILDDVLYFNADDDVHGLELWRSDGTAAGTVMVRDIEPGMKSSTPFLPPSGPANGWLRGLPKKQFPCSQKQNPCSQSPVSSASPSKEQSIATEPWADLASLKSKAQLASLLKVCPSTTVLLQHLSFYNILLQHASIFCKVSQCRCSSLITERLLCFSTSIFRRTRTRAHCSISIYTCPFCHAYRFYSDPFPIPLFTRRLQSRFRNMLEKQNRPGPPRNHPILAQALSKILDFKA
jgi:ELWxxDGT repeat protein